MSTPSAATPTGQHRFDLVISGASFAGLALASALSDATAGTMSIALVDRALPAPTPKPDARAFALSAASKRLLDCLGVWDQLSPEAQPVETIEITDTSLGSAARPPLLSYDNHIAENGHEPATYILPATTLVTALEAAAAKRPGLTFLRGTEATSIVAEDTNVSLTLDDGKALKAALFVGAEGRRSAAREAAGIKTVAWAYGQIAIVTTIAHSRPHEARAIQHFLPGGPFALLPLPGNRCCITWSEGWDEAIRILALDDAGFLAEIENRVAGRLGTLTLAGPRQSWPLETSLARSYIGKRLALVGDAAHGVHPIAGQGVNLAFRDVAALTEVLVEARRIGGDIGAANVLERYERWRRFDSTVAAVTFDGLNRLFSNDWTLLRAARDFGLGLVDRTPALKSFFVTEAAGLAGDIPRLLKGEPV